MRSIRLLCIGLFGLFVIGCSDDDPVGPDPELAAGVIVNAAFGTADVDVLVDGTLVATDLDFGDFTGSCLALPAEEAITITFRSGGTVLATADVTLEDAEQYTILLTDDATGVDAVVLEDDATVPTGQRAVRFVNATDDPVDAYMFVSGGAMGDPVLADLAYVGSLSADPAYIFRDAAQTVIRFYEPNVTTGTGLAQEILPSAAVALGATVILTENATGFDIFALGPC